MAIKKAVVMDATGASATFHVIGNVSIDATAKVTIATVMSCTLSVDHRVADGALGAEWMAVFKTIMEDPLSLML